MEASHKQGYLKGGAVVALVLGLGVLIPQCILLPEEGFKGEETGNIRPIVSITGGVLEDGTDSENRVHFYWYGADDDGVIRWFEWAVDDTTTEDAWQRTTEFDIEVAFRAATLDSTENYTDWHTFFIRSVDDTFSRSRPDMRFFNAHTIAPTSRIVQPDASDDDPDWAQTLKVTWSGEDLDATAADQLPAYFEIKLVIATGVDIANEQSVRRLFRDGENLMADIGDTTLYPPDSDLLEQARRAWVRVDGQIDFEWLTGMTPGVKHGFAIRAVDEAGAAEQKFARGQNWVVFNVANKHITVVISEPALGARRFDFAEFPIGDQAWRVTVAPNQRIRFRWFGDATDSGTDPGPSNYGWDIPEPDDETFRDINGQGGWIGWATRLRMQETISFPASDVDVKHFFYLKMRDISDNPDTETRCTIEVEVANFSFSRKFLLVDGQKNSPKPCTGVPPKDDVTDFWRLAFNEETQECEAGVLASICEYLPPGEGPGEHLIYGSEVAQQTQPEIPDDFLKLLGNYQTVIWDCANNQSDDQVGLAIATREMILSRYVGLGGNLLLWVHRGPVLSVTGSFPFGDDEPKCPNPDVIADDEFWNRFSFLWQFLRMRGCADKPRNPTGTGADNRKSLVGVEASHPQYPDLDLGPSRWVCGSNYKGIVNYECLVPSPGEEDLTPWYDEDRIDGLEVLYTARTLRVDSPLAGKPVAWRTWATDEDTEAGLDRGRIICFSFHPYFFEETSVAGAMSLALNWLVTGSDVG